MDVFIPKWYIPSERQRMEIYRRLVGCETPAALEQLAADLSDAYGKCPEMVEMLLEMAEIRLRAAGIGIGSVLKMPPDIIFSVRDHAKAESFLKDLPGSVRLPDPKTVHWRPPKAYLEPATLLRVLIRRLRQTDGDL
jgi:transcription-repair coupling factor (superfamily II helicase)